MALIRGHHSFDDHFAQIPNQWLRDNRLSLEARGLLAQIMSHAPGWNLSIQSIAGQNNIGRDKVRRILNELFEYGYLERSETQAHDEKGRLVGFDYVTRDPEGVTQKPTKAEPTKAEPTKVIEPPKNTIPKNTIVQKTIGKKPAIADDYQPSATILKNFDTEYPGLNLATELAKFKDHHAAKGSKFADWDRAFRNWLRRAVEWSPDAKRLRASKEFDDFLAKVKAAEDAGDMETVQRLMRGDGDATR